MNRVLLVLCLGVFIWGCSTSKKPVKKVEVAEVPKAMVTKPERKSDQKSYRDVITVKAKTDLGLFKVHELAGKYYYEIPRPLLGKDILLVTRIAQIPSNLSPYLNAGSETNKQVVRWEVKNDKMLLKSISFDNVAVESAPIYKSVAQNNFSPIITSFDIEVAATDSTGYLVQINKLFDEDVPALSGLDETIRKNYKVSRFDKSRSFIDTIKSFPTNIEAIHTMTYIAGAPPSNKESETLTMQMNQSMILLPELKMVPRLYDDRVGWFTTKTIDYTSEELKSDVHTYLRRWKLEPKDKAAYLRGELVEPVKPIVYYLDPATPQKFRKYFKQGIEDWKVAFEAAGFKNAIIAKDPPSFEEDPEFSPEDARYSVVRYVASTTRNAVGPSVSDPRTGEIIESDIIWYHNHLRSYRNRYLIETGAANPAARTLETSTEDIGEMMRRVICHEVGHALGLPHNMKASSAYPTDSLRSGAFTQKNGIAATIMDYARFNYVAQPEDKNIRFVRQMGPYDLYAIEFGYRWYPDIRKPEDEKGILHRFVTKYSGDPVYQFGEGNGSFDPNSQTECIGNDAIKASSYGLKNLKIVAENLMKWTAKKDADYEDLDEIYGELMGIWGRYIGHVSMNIGGVYETRKTQDQQGVVYAPVSSKTQKDAALWMVNNAFATPSWLMNPEIIQRITYKGVLDRVSGLQNRALMSVFQVESMTRMLDNEFINQGRGVYTLAEMINDISVGIWSDLYGKDKSDAVKRNLQRNYIGQIEAILKDKASAASKTDIHPILRAHLKSLEVTLKARSATAGIEGAHYRDVLDRIQAIFEKK